TAASDVYQLASTIWTMLVGRTPFTVGDGFDAQEYARRVLTEEAPPVGRQDISRKLRGVLSRALAKAPQERHESAADFAAAFEQARTSRPATTVSGPSGAQAPLTGASAPVDPPPVPGGAQPPTSVLPTTAPEAPPAGPQNPYPHPVPSGEQAPHTGAQTPPQEPHAAPSGAQPPFPGPHTAPSGAQAPISGPHATPSGAQAPLSGPHATPSGAQAPHPGPQTPPLSSQGEQVSHTPQESQPYPPTTTGHSSAEVSQVPFPYAVPGGVQAAHTPHEPQPPHPAAAAHPDAQVPPSRPQASHPVADGEQAPHTGAQTPPQEPHAAPSGAQPPFPGPHTTPSGAQAPHPSPYSVPSGEQAAHTPQQHLPTPPYAVSAPGHVPNAPLWPRQTPEAPAPPAAPPHPAEHPPAPASTRLDSARQLRGDQPTAAPGDDQSGSRLPATNAGGTAEIMMAKLRGEEISPLLAWSRVEGWSGTTESGRLPEDGAAARRDETPEWPALHEPDVSQARWRKHLHLAASVCGILLLTSVSGAFASTGPQTPILSAAEPEEPAAEPSPGTDEATGDEEATGDGADGIVEPTVPEPINAPTDVRLADTLNAVQLSWTDNSGGTAPFFVVGGPRNVEPTTLARTGAGVTSAQITTTDTYGEYCFTVVAVDGSSAPAEEVCTTRAADRAAAAAAEAEAEEEAAEEDEAEPSDAPSPDSGE
ncbi:protein kinase family protein, partial [Nocardiopsis lucentensis]|uniref:hypothetical protein n=1 Tax=Nocardiopsis lucentensis TaxID=53441 RepID=UPI001378CADF